MYSSLRFLIYRKWLSLLSIFHFKVNTSVAKRNDRRKLALGSGFKGYSENCRHGPLFYVDQFWNVFILCLNYLHWDYNMWLIRTNSSNIWRNLLKYYSLNIWRKDPTLNDFGQPIGMQYYSGSFALFNSWKPEIMVVNTVACRYANHTDTNFTIILNERKIQWIQWFQRIQRF